MINKKHLMLLCVTFLCSVANASVLIDGLYYNLNNENKTAEVTYKDNFNVYGGVVTIPRVIIYNSSEYTVTGIGAGAFEGQRLTSLTLPNSISYIASAFNGSEFSLRVSDLESWCKIVFNDRLCNPLVSAEHFYIDNVEVKDLIIPDGITEIKDCAFYHCYSLESVTLPSNTKLIGRYAFGECKNLKRINLNNVSEIQEYAFQTCERLESVYVPSSVVNWSWHWSAFKGCTGITSVEFHCPKTERWFSELKSLEEIIIGNEVKTIGSSSFYYCPNLTNIIMGDSVTKIEDDAFAACQALTSITIPSKVNSIGISCFSGCDGLKEMRFYTTSAPSCSDLFGGEGWASFYYENLILYVHDYAVESFKEHPIWSNFQSLVVYEKTTDFNLTYYVDGDVYKTEKHKYEDDLTPETYPKRKGMTFSGWSDIPAKMPGKDVDVKGTFSWSKITMDNVIYEVADTVNNYVAVIGNGNASGEISIAPDIDFDYSYKVTSIADKAFNGCKGITLIDMPATIISIGERAFAGIDKLTDVIVYAENVPETDRTAFENSYIDYVTLHIPNGSMEKYKSVGPWKDFKEIVAIEGTEPVSIETCAMPTISFLDGKLEFKSETDGSECHYEIKVEDAKAGVGSEVTLSSAYEISVYASKKGYNDSEKNIATLYWINVDPISTGIVDNEMRVNTNVVLVQNTGGVIIVSGVANDSEVMLYNIAGQFVAKGKAFGNNVEISTSLASGDICIIKIGDRSVKYILR